MRVSGGLRRLFKRQGKEREEEEEEETGPELKWIHWGNANVYQEWVEKDAGDG